MDVEKVGNHCIRVVARARGKLTSLFEVNTIILLQSSNRGSSARRNGNWGWDTCTSSWFSSNSSFNGEEIRYSAIESNHIWNLQWNPVKYQSSIKGGSLFIRLDHVVHITYIDLINLSLCMKVRTIFERWSNELPAQYIDSHWKRLYYKYCSWGNSFCDVTRQKVKFSENLIVTVFLMKKLEPRE